MNSEAMNAICKLCKRIAANPEFIPEPLRPYFFGARLIPIAKKDGGMRPIAIGTIFHKLISSAVMCNHQGEATWLLLSSAVWCVCSRMSRECNA